MSPLDEMNLRGERDPIDELPLGHGRTASPAEPPDDLGGDLTEDSGGNSSGRSKWPWILGLGIGLLVCAVLVIYSIPGRDAEEPPEVAAVESPAPAEPEPVLPASEPEVEPLPVELPELDESDEVVFELVSRLSDDPYLPELLVRTDDLVRRFTVVVDNVAEGVSPRSHLPFLAPSRPFTTRVTTGPQGEEQLVIAPESYARYDRLANLFASMDTELAVRILRTLEPLVDQANRELGYPDRNLDPALRRAAERLLAVPVPREAPVVVRQTLSYKYKDESLEALSPAQKHLLRMGPANIQRVQAKIREVLAALDR